MVGFGRHFQHFQLDVGTQGCKNMVALRGDGSGGRLGQGSILLERLMIRFHVPSFAIDCGTAVVDEFEVAGDQIEIGRASCRERV